jgi:hypothetical protein
MKSKNANSTIAKPRVTSRKPTVTGSPGGRLRVADVRDRNEPPHAQDGEGEERQAQHEGEPSSQSWAAVASLIRRRKLR